MLMAADCSVRLGLVEADLALRLERLLVRAGLPTRGPALGAARYLRLMGHDKKADAGQIRYVLLRRLGEAVMQPVADALVAEVIERRCAPA
jgi:3-dehydroquinate synthase